MPCTDSSGLFWIQELKQFPPPGSPDQHLPVPGGLSATTSPAPSGTAVFAQVLPGAGGFFSLFTWSRRVLFSFSQDQEVLLSFYLKQEDFAASCAPVLLAGCGSRGTELTQGSAP